MIDLSDIKEITDFSKARKTHTPKNCVIMGILS